MIAPPPKSRCPAHPPAGALAARLQALIGKESVSSFARRCGLAESVLRTYLKDGRMPPLDKAMAIAATAGVSIDWLATGIAAQQAAQVPAKYAVAPLAVAAQLDVGILEQVLATVLAADGVQAPPAELAVQVVDAYRRAIEAAGFDGP